MSVRTHKNVCTIFTTTFCSRTKVQHRIQSAQSAFANLHAIGQFCVCWSHNGFRIGQNISTWRNRKFYAIPFSFATCKNIIVRGESTNSKYKLQIALPKVIRRKRFQTAWNVSTFGHPQIIKP